MKKYKFPKEYISACMVYTILSMLFTLLITIIYLNSVQMYNHNTTAIYHLCDMQSAMLNININTECLISNNYDSREEVEDNIKVWVSQLNSAVSHYNMISADTAEDDYAASFRNNIEIYRKNVENIVNTKGSIDDKKVNYRNNVLYVYYIINDDIENLIISYKDSSNYSMDKLKSFYIMTLVGVLFLIIIGDSVLLYVGYKIKSKEEQVELSQKEIEYQKEMASKAKQKTIDIAFTDVLLDCGNRYALVKDIEKRIKNKKDFYMSRFVITDFEELACMIGYNQMDDYKIKISEYLKENYSNYAGIFTLNGNDFVLLFDSDLRDEQVEYYAGEIRENIVGLTAKLDIYVAPNISGILTKAKVEKGQEAEQLLSNLSAGYLKIKADGGNRLYKF